MNWRANGIIGMLICCVPISSPAQPDSAILKVGDAPPALDFKVYKSSKTIDWSSLKNRVIVLEFWATWCSPCVENIPKMDSLAAIYSGKAVSFISVTYETEGMVEKFLRQHPMHTMIGLDNDFAMFKSYKAWGIPMTVVVSAKKRIACVIHPNKLDTRVLDEVLAGRIPRVEPARPWSDPKGAEEYFRSLTKKEPSDK